MFFDPGAVGKHAFGIHDDFFSVFSRTRIDRKALQTLKPPSSTIISALTSLLLFDFRVAEVQISQSIAELPV